MSGWIWLWICAIAAITVYAAWDDHRDRLPLTRITFGVLTGVVCIAAVVAFFVEPVATALGKWLLPLVIGAGIQFVVEGIHDLRQMTPDPELTARENLSMELFGGGIVVLVFGAALLAGIVAGTRQW